MTTSRPPGRLRTVLRWPLGIALVSWRYMWRTTPLHRSEETGSAADLPELGDRAASRRRPPAVSAGVGPLLHRLYAVRIADSAHEPGRLIERWPRS